MILDNVEKGARVAVAMSGGVDSSVCAAALSLAGYEVIGITLQLYDQGEVAKTRKTCCAGQDIYDAKRVAEQIGFSHYVLDYESVFKQNVIDNFADSYLRGETPIPCVQCNQKVKFLDLFNTAKDLDCAALVTGHYVRRMSLADGPELHKASDLSKDQSYFLFSTTKEQLEYIRFPLGEYNKAYTRQLAKDMGLEIADKPDSQDICFVPGGDYRSVITKLRPNAIKKGHIVHIDGAILGEHTGIINFTIGQRKGLGISSTTPLYVVKMEPESQTVFVGPKEALKTKYVEVSNVNWLISHCEKRSDEAIGYHLNDPVASALPRNDIIQGEVKVRSTQQSLPANIQYIDQNNALVEILADEYGISKGQACVFYDGTKVLGGGWIVGTR